MNQQEYLQKRSEVIDNPKIVFIKTECRKCNSYILIPKERRDNLCIECQSKLE